MQITPEQLHAEAAALALEVRFKDRALAAYEAEIKRLNEKLAELDAKEPEAEVPDKEETPAKA